MELAIVFQQLGIALGLGLLVGMQRERVATKLAGVRTFPLVTILGALSALLAQTFGGWVLAAGVLALAGMIFANKEIEARGGAPDPGLTTEVALLLMYVVGAYVVVGQREVAIAVGGGVAVLLQFKGEMHGMVARMGDNDLKAVMQFALISLVILPVLPNRAFGPFLVLNPRQIWWMVVLIVGIGLVGYVFYKFLDEKVGIVLGGFLGGVISSTATTASYARRAKGSPSYSRLASIVIVIASAVVFVRVLIEISVVAPGFLPVALPPLAGMLILMIALSGWAWFWGRRDGHEMPVQNNPSELKPALVFALLYAVALFAVAAVKELFGSGALYIVALLSGLTDMDAITLSTSQMVHAGRIGQEQGWRLILVAGMSNLLFKAGIVGVLGHRKLLARIVPLFGIVFLAGVLILLFWPAP